MKNYLEVFSLVALLTINLGTILYLFMQKSILFQAMSYSMAALIY